MLTPPHTIRPWPLPRASSPLIDAAREALAAIPDTQQREERAELIYKELTATGTPLVENTLVTFVWYGDAPHGVILNLNKVTDMLDPADTRLESIAGTGLHALTLDMPTEWMGTYNYSIPGSELPAPALHGGADREMFGMLRASAVEDPRAREYVGAVGFLGNARLAVARGRDADRAVLSGDTEGIRVAQVMSPVNGAELTAWTWKPADDVAPAARLVVLDGETWVNQYPLVSALQEVPVPIHAVFIESGGPQQRQLDYTSDADAGYSFIERALGLLGDGSGAPVIVVGQSMGGLFALLSGMRHPDLVAAAIAQSPSLWWNGGAWFDERSRQDGAPAYLQVGAYEWDLERDVHHAAALLRAQGKLLGFDMYPGGHDALWWQALLPGVLAEVVGKV